MSDDFDPYYRWLGIRDKQRPPNHYRLLGLDPFEENSEVIAEAADRQMGHVRTHQNGQYSVLSQELLNELAKAKVCLLNRNRKSAYDQHLRKALGVSEPAKAAHAPSAHATAAKIIAAAQKTAVAHGAPTVVAPQEGIGQLKEGEGGLAQSHATVAQPANRAPHAHAPASSPANLTIKLTVLSGPQKGQVFEVTGRDTFTVGRGHQATFVIKGDKAFSRVHFSIRINPPVCYLKNLNDKKGTKVNGKQVTETLLKSGDTISGGAETNILVEIRSAEPSASVPPADATPNAG